MYRVLLITLACTLLGSCIGLNSDRKDPSDLFKGENREMMHAAKRIEKMINNYHVETAEWPETLADAAMCMPPGETWPTEPWGGREIRDTGSPDFQAGVSQGMVYYQKLERNGMTVSYMLHVFGEKDKIYIIGNTAFGPKE